MPVQYQLHARRDTGQALTLSATVRLSFLLCLSLTVPAWMYPLSVLFQPAAFESSLLLPRTHLRQHATNERDPFCRAEILSARPELHKPATFRNRCPSLQGNEYQAKQLHDVRFRSFSRRQIRANVHRRSSTPS